MLTPSFEEVPMLESLLTVAGLSILIGLLATVALPRRQRAPEPPPARDVDDPVALTMLYGIHL